MSRYRAEVDGLRAVAVLPVILFHAGVEGLTGGFLGVDVFFVISGYLISRIILDEVEGGGFSLLSFYERRARRILPALFVVMAFTLPVAYHLAPPEAFTSYLSSLRATALFFSNIHFWWNIGYFNPAAEEQPLLHTWSLGVEEQFYILFPLLLWVVWRFAKRHMLPISVSCGLLAFAVCLYQQSRSTDAAFFLLHARAWELFAGVIVTLLERRMDFASLRKGLFGNMLMVAGLASIVIGFFSVSSADDVPGWPTLYPVVGTVFVLLFGSSGGVAGRLLTAKPVVALGLVSYSAYLWHHPLFAFARLYTINQPELSLMLGLAVAALLLAILTYHLVEKPFRDRKRLSRSVVLLLAPAATFVAVAVSTLGLERNWAESRFAPELLARVLPPLYKTENCAWTFPEPDAPDLRFCRIGALDAPRPVVIWGDSHAQALVGEIDTALKLKGWSGVYVNTTRCLRVPGVYDLNSKIDREAAACRVKQERAFKVISALQPRAFVVSLRWTMRIYPLPGAGPTVGFDNGEGGVEVESSRQLAALGNDGKWSVGLAAKTTAVISFFERLTHIAPLVVVGPVPEVGWNVGNRNFKTVVLRHQDIPDINTSIAVYQARNESILAILGEASKIQSLTLVEPSALFCDTMVQGRCVAQQAGISYYSDDDHLSQTGARMLVEQIVKALPQP